MVQTDHFNAIKLTGSLDVVYTQTDGRVYVEAYGSDTIVDLLDVYTKNGSLNVGFKRNVKISKGKKLEVRVFAPSLDRMEITGSGEMTIASGLKTDGDLSLSVTGVGDVTGSDICCAQLSLSVTGVGDITLNRVTAGNTRARISGVGDINLSGTTQHADYFVSGVGDINAAQLTADRVSANVTGVGDISCYAVSFIKVRKTGVGNISYKGNPEVRK